MIEPITVSNVPELMAALNVMNETGGEIHLMPGTYFVDNDVAIPDNVALVARRNVTHINIDYLNS